MLLSLVFFTNAARAAITLPLQGFCRPGRFFPILVDGDDARRSITLSADGCLSSQADAQLSGSVIVPMLATGAAHELRWAGGSLPLHMLRDDERLVAANSVTAGAAVHLFPGKRLVHAWLDTANLLPGPPAAWETLDAIVLDSPLFQRISDGQRSALLAAGVQLVAIGDSPPDHRWPWLGAGSVWNLSPMPAGPSDELMDDTVYAPTFGWTPGWSGAVRGQVMGIAALLVLGTVGLLLIRRNRITAALTIILSCATALGVAAWRRSLGSIDRCGGDVIVAGDGLVQRDSWVYQRAKTTSIQAVPWAGWTHPIFASQGGMNAADMQVHMGADASLSFTYRSDAGHTMAFVRRDIEPGVRPQVSHSHDSPMWDAAKAAYFAPGLRVDGELPGEGGRWAGVVLTR